MRTVTMMVVVLAAMTLGATPASQPATAPAKTVAKAEDVLALMPVNIRQAFMGEATMLQRQIAEQWVRDNAWDGKMTFSGAVNVQNIVMLSAKRAQVQGVNSMGDPVVANFDESQVPLLAEVKPNSTLLIRGSIEQCGTGFHLQRAHDGIPERRTTTFRVTAKEFSVKK